MARRVSRAITQTAGPNQDRQLTKLTVFGLKTCDACKRARKELDAAGLAYAFHDMRDDGVTPAQIARWTKAAGWETMLNKASTTWRSLPDADKANLTEVKAVALMAAHPTLIKRPLIERGGVDVFVGWPKNGAKAFE
jgi:Spx/MgsR family transcriptional regulator